MSDKPNAFQVGAAAYPTEEAIRAPGTYANNVRAAWERDTVTLYFFQFPTDVMQLPEGKQFVERIEKEKVTSDRELPVTLSPVAKIIVQGSVLPNVIKLLQQAMAEMTAMTSGGAK